MKIQIELNDEQITKLNELKKTREGKTDSELLMQVVDRGLYDLNYRTKRNKQVWGEFKQWKNSQKQ